METITNKIKNGKTRMEDKKTRMKDKMKFKKARMKGKMTRMKDSVKGKLKAINRTTIKRWTGVAGCVIGLVTTELIGVGLCGRIKNPIVSDVCSAAYGLTDWIIWTGAISEIRKNVR